MSIRPIFAWYDFWLGAYWNAASRKLYILPLPMVGIVIQFEGGQPMSEQPPKPEPGGEPGSEEGYERVDPGTVSLDGSARSRQIAEHFKAPKPPGAEKESGGCCEKHDLPEVVATLAEEMCSPAPSPPTAEKSGTLDRLIAAARGEGDSEDFVIDLALKAKSERVALLECREAWNAGRVTIPGPDFLEWIAARVMRMEGLDPEGRVELDYAARLRAMAKAARAALEQADKAGE